MTTTKHILAMRSERGEISLFDRIDYFMASFKDGKWVADDIFDFDDVWENFRHLTDDQEIIQIMAEARAALGQPLSTGLCHPSDTVSSG